MTEPLQPRILVIDDLFGRSVVDGGNEERADLCRRFRLVDVTGDQPETMSIPRFREPLAEAVFTRGQQPAAGSRGDVVSNDISGILARVREGWESNAAGTGWALVLLDLCFYTGRITAGSERERGRGMPAGRPADRERYFGLDVLAALSETFPGLPVVILSSMPRSDVAAEYPKRGAAVGFLDRGTENAEGALRDFLIHHALMPDLRGEFVGGSAAVLHALRAARRSAERDRPVLIRGERGTGKELVARYIHRHRGPTRPFVAVNCGQFAEPNLAFSTLFGHRRGSFTGAQRDRRGAVMEAQSGILFLDEIANLPLEVQGGLHRMLQEREVAPLGGEERPLRDVSVKLLAASNADLDGLALKEPAQFMPDLLDRLKLGDVVLLPPLRERFEDLPALVDRFVRQAEEEGGPGTWRQRAVDPEVYEYLRRYDWPGNVRELEGCVKRAVSTFKHMEVLLPRCIDLPDTGRRPVQQSTPDKPADSQQIPLPADFAQWLGLMHFDEARPAELHGRLGEILQLLSSYLEAVLRATARPSASDDDVELVIHAAGKWMTGDPKQSALQAADWFKRLLKVLERAGPLKPTLRKALARATEIAERSKKGTKGAASGPH